MIAPLLGLLGTVMGMIETFDSLSDMALFSSSGGIAGGISQALITTQIGLVIAIPGLLFERHFTSKRESFLEELTELKGLIIREKGKILDLMEPVFKKEKVTDA